MEPKSQFNKIISTILEKARNDLNARYAFPFGLIQNLAGKIKIVDPFEDPNYRKGKNPTEMVNDLKVLLKAKLEEKASAIMSALVYYGLAQINDRGDQANAVVINIENFEDEDIPLFVYPYQNSGSQGIVFLDYYRMNKKQGRFYS